MNVAQFLPSATPVRLIDETGMAVNPAARSLPGDEDLLRGYEALVVGRRINEQAYALVRQGRLAVYPSTYGQEACEVAAALVLGDQDWLFPTYRDTVSIIARGVDPIEALVLLRGDWHSGYDPIATRVAPQSTPLATQLIHAVGVAHAATLRGEDTVVMAMCGDGATSEGDFHEALNFAAVFHAPVVFFVQNNEYAISVPLAKQSVAPSLAHKGIGYGVPGERVDGNDVAALLAVLGDAVDSARGGGGPQLIEAHTYRMQAHTNADDDSRYRPEEELSAWRDRDPIIRMEAYLRRGRFLTEAGQAGIVEKAESVATRMRTGLMAEVEVDPQDLFKYVYSTPTPQLREQAAFLDEELSREVAL